jgi:hypothetical protein
MFMCYDLFMPCSPLQNTDHMKTQYVKLPDHFPSVLVYCWTKGCLINVNSRRGKHCLNEGRGVRENGNVIDGVTLFRVHCTEVWNYHNEITSYY